MIITELQLNLQSHINICCCSFNKILIKREKAVLQENFDSTINFDLMINFDFFCSNNLGFPPWFERKIWFVDVS